ncbi:MAG TPA: UvrD-helicase domain-containing protein [Candidatus Xenobia bacterium]
MQWARNKRFEVNPVLGSLQVYEVLEGGKLPTSLPAEPNDGRDRLFGSVADAKLALAGVPDQLLPSVRALRCDADLDGLAPYLPREAADALYLMATGMSLEQALEELARTPIPPVPVNVQDFKKALEHPESKRRFHLIDSERELAEMLNAPLDLWRRFLHPSQERLVSMQARGPVQVLGGAGTGKTVVLMHRARHLAKEVFNQPDDRILVTTFTRNLSADLRHQLQALCGSEYSRLEVVNLHQWATQFMRSQGVAVSILDERTARRFWDQTYGTSSAGLHIGFFKDEWKQVVQAQGITTKEEYLQAPRTGRGTSLSRKQRLEVWRVFEEYRALVEGSGRLEFADIVRETRRYLEKNPGMLPYKAVLADEVQDFSLADLRLLRTLVPQGGNDLFVVGDAHQRIYGHRTSLGKAGIEIRGRSRRLYINYRTTDAIGKWAVALLSGVPIDDLDEHPDTLQGYRALRPGVRPDIQTFPYHQEEGTFIQGQVRRWLQSVKPEEVCIAARTKEILTDRVRPALAGIETVMVNEESDERLGPGVRLATMHRLKGLEFPNVLIAALDRGIVPYELPDERFGDAVSHEDYETDERCLLYVAATRARDELVMTATRPASVWLDATAVAGTAVG